MKKLCVLAAMLFLFGCSSDDPQMERGLKLREELLKCTSCAFTAEVTADFGDKTYSFTLDCTGSSDGSLSFAVVSPETISGISGVLAADGGKITFDEDQAVAFPVLAEGEITPVSAPWLLYSTLRSGYILACGTDEQQLRMTMNDTYEDNAFQVDIWLNTEDRPEYAEIIWEGRLVLSLRVEDFEIL